MQNVSKNIFYYNVKCNLKPQPFKNAQTVDYTLTMFMLFALCKHI